MKLHFHNVIFLEVLVAGKIPVGDWIQSDPALGIGDPGATNQFVVLGADGRIRLDGDQQSEMGLLRVHGLRPNMGDFEMSAIAKTGHFSGHKTAVT